MVGAVSQHTLVCCASWGIAHWAVGCVTHAVGSFGCALDSVPLLYRWYPLVHPFCNRVSWTFGVEKIMGDFDRKFPASDSYNSTMQSLLGVLVVFLTCERQFDSARPCSLMVEYNPDRLLRAIRVRSTRVAADDGH